MELRKQCEVDWADWFCEGDHAKSVKELRIDPSLVKAFFTYAWALGRVRGTTACMESVEPFQELVG